MVESECFDSRPNPEPNGDISGPGVLVGFLGSAYLTIIVLTAYYLLVFQPRRNPYPRDHPSHAFPPGAGGISNHGMPLLQQQNPVTASNGCDSVVPNTASQSDHASMPSFPTSGIGGSAEDWTANPIDVFVLENRVSQWVLPRLNFQNGNDFLQIKIERAFRKYMLSSCDIQMITGLGILISAFATLKGPSGISAYHWQLVVLLAWSANLTPLLGLTFMRQHLQMHPFQRSWRLVLMAIIFVLLLVALFPTAYFNWQVDLMVANAGKFARCYFDFQFIKEIELFGSFPPASGVTMILSMVVLFFTCTTRVLKLSRRASRFIRQRARRQTRNICLCMMDFASRGLPTQQPRLDALRISLVLQPMAAFLLMARLYLDFYASTSSDIWWAWATTAWVTMRIFQSKQSAPVSEGDLTFGQIMAVLLLMVPMIMAGVALQQILGQLIQRRRDSASESRQSRPEDESDGDCTQTVACESPPRGSPPPTVEDERHELCRHEYIIDLVKNSPASYDQPWSSAVIILMWLQIFLSTLAFFIMTSGIVFGMSTTAFDFVWLGGVSMALQPFTCSFLILVGIECMPSKEQRTGRLESQASGTSKVLPLLLHWRGGLIIHTVLMLGLTGGFIYALPLHWDMLANYMYYLLFFCCPWASYFTYALIKAVVFVTS